MAYQHTSWCQPVEASLNEKRPLSSQLCRHLRTIELSEKFALAYIALYNSGFIHRRETLADQLPQHVVPDNDQTRAARTFGCAARVGRECLSKQVPAQQ